MLWIKDSSKILKKKNMYLTSNKGSIHYLRKIICKDNSILNKMNHSLKKSEIGEPFNTYKLKKVKYQIHRMYSWKHVKLTQTMIVNAVSSNPFIFF